MLVDDERRDFHRMITETQMSLTRLSSGERLKAQLTNLSASGCAFYSDLAFEEGEELEVDIRGSNDRLEPFCRTGRVARITQDENGRLIGVQFTAS